MIYNNFNFQGMILMKTNKQVKYSTAKINLIDLNVLLCNQGTNVFFFFFLFYLKNKIMLIIAYTKGVHYGK